MRASDMVIIAVTGIGVLASLVGAIWIGKRQRRRKAVKAAEKNGK